MVNQFLLFKKDDVNMCILHYHLSLGLENGFFMLLMTYENVYVQFEFTSDKNVSKMVNGTLSIWGPQRSLLLFCKLVYSFKTY